MNRYSAMLACLVLSWPALIAGQQKIEYRLLVIGKPDKIEQMMNELAAEGFRFAAGLDRAGTMKTSRLVVMQRAEGSVPAVRYRVIRAGRVETLQEKLIQAGRDGYALLALEPNQRATSFIAYCERHEAEP